FLQRLDDSAVAPPPQPAPPSARKTQPITVPIEEVLEIESTPAPEDDLAGMVQRTMQLVNRAQAEARRLMKEGRYEDALKALDLAPAHLRDASLHQEANQKAARVAVLDREAREDAKAQRLAGLRSKVAELLELQPSRADLKKLLATLPVLGDQRELVNSLG